MLRDGAAGVLSAGALTAAAWLVGLTVTALIFGTPYLGFGYQNRSLHLILDSLDGCVALLVAYLVYGRFLRTSGLREMLIAQGMLLLAVAGLGLSLLLSLFHDFRAETVDVWLPLTVRVIGAVLIAASALAGDRRVKSARKAWAWLAPWVVIAVAFLVLWIERDRLPVALGPTPPAFAVRPLITGHWLVQTAHGIAAVCFVVASARFTVQAARAGHDELLRWLGPACALAAFARLNYLLFPSLYTDWFYTGDLLRTASYLVLLVGAAREIRAFWTAQARASVLEDRRRLARELHDGVVQEIAFVRAEACVLGSAAADRIVSSCDRALGEARTAIDALGRNPDEPLGFVLHRAVRELAERYDGCLEVDIDDSVTAEPPQRQALVRITREAVSNALRHGHGHRVCIRLIRDLNARQLVVQDDGIGFDVQAASRMDRGYGLTSMRERAEALPGQIRIVSTPGQGTEVRVSW